MRRDSQLDRRRFKARLHEALLTRNVGVPELSTLTGISRQTLYSYLSPEGSIPRIGDVRRELLADALHLRLDWLSGLGGERDAHGHEEEAPDAGAEDK